MVYVCSEGGRIGEIHWDFILLSYQTHLPIWMILKRLTISLSKTFPSWEVVDHYYSGALKLTARFQPGCFYRIVLLANGWDGSKSLDIITKVFGWIKKLIQNQTNL